jgi:hypothetical protein
VYTETSLVISDDYNEETEVVKENVLQFSSFF